MFEYRFVTRSCCQCNATGWFLHDPCPTCEGKGTTEEYTAFCPLCCPGTAAYGEGTRRQGTYEMPVFSVN